MIVAFVDEHRDEFGVEPICRVLQIAPSTYYAAKKRQFAPSARAVRDAVLIQVLMVLWVANRKVYGAHKLWKAARRAGHDVGRDQVARLMNVIGQPLAPHSSSALVRTTSIASPTVGSSPQTSSRRSANPSSSAS